MTKKRVKFNTILERQLPSYVREEFPLVAEFLKQYYLSQEFTGAPYDLIQNIDQYIKLDEIKSNTDFAILSNDISFDDDVITVSSESGTIGFPDSYGLIKIDDEIITYEYKTSNSFVNCIRGFSGISSYSNVGISTSRTNSLSDLSDQLVFESTESKEHLSGSKITNLSSLFLKEFLKKIKYQLIPGFEGRELYSNLDQYLFLKQSKDFYSSKGTDISYKILFKVLYGEDVDIVKPQNSLIRPSNAGFNVINALVVESIEGDPYNLRNSTLFQDEYGDITKCYASISDVEKIYSTEGKEYYRLGFDGGYNRDIGVSGALYGNFSIHPKTRIIGDVNPDVSTIDVDSTVGFPSSGDLFVTYEDGTTGVVSYASKSLTQFFGCVNITKKIFDASDISLNVFAYGSSSQSDSNETIKVRINSVLNEVSLVDDEAVYYQISGDNAIIRTLGADSIDPISNSWIFNIQTTYEVKEISVFNSSSKIYSVKTSDKHNFATGDSVNLISNNGSKTVLSIIGVVSDTEVYIGSNIAVPTNFKYTIEKVLTKVRHTLYNELSNQNANVQNIYKIKEKTLVASPSLPFYNGQSLNASDRSLYISGTFPAGDTFRITNQKDHGFYTGDCIYYESSGETSDIPRSLFDSGVYYIKRVDANNVQFAKSSSDIQNSKFLKTEENINVASDKIILQQFKSKSLISQKLLREISLPYNDGKNYETFPGPTGILINGTEILNYKSKDIIYYGPVESIDVSSGGSEYDVISPPVLDITDSIGIGATGYCAVSGGLFEIRLLDPGFDYVSKPTIRITGGNGVGAVADVSTKFIDHEVFFNSEQKFNEVNIINNSIGFSTYHKFRNAEKITYYTNNQKGVGGISTNAEYYARVVDLKTLTIHNSAEDALVGINTVSLTTYGIGNHSFKCINKKQVISTINVLNPGFGYQNKIRTTSPSGINTSTNSININEHDFNSGEIVRYTSSGTAIGGLTKNSDYYLTKIDDNNFKLSIVGVSSSNQDFYYTTNQYVDLTSRGTGVHYFNYQPISVEVVGEIGVSTSAGVDFAAKIQPVFRGEITSFHLQNGGRSYGTPEVLNYLREPLLILRQGKSSEIVPIINNGRIVEVLVNNSGYDYNNAPTINISGDGLGAVLVPIVENGQIKQVKIINGGIGYSQKNTFITVQDSGSGATFKSKLKSWNINLVSRNFSNTTPDDGFVFYNSYTKGGLQYSHLYAPRKLRESIYSVDPTGRPSYGNFDLSRVGGSEVSSTKHSPIIGWAYDGNPIYGPYGYAKKDASGGGSITQMKSGYKLAPVSSDRPSEKIYPLGFFVEDYKYYTRLNQDDSVLDEHNGRFCVTPEFPNGVYAYFCTIAATTTRTSSSPFRNYRIPVFPYLIGNTFKSRPNEFNFKASSNQDDIDLNKTDWIRYTKNYNLLGEKSYYKYLDLPNRLNQTSTIKYASPGNIQTVGILTGGNNYSINDLLVSDETDTRGYGFSARVSKLKGKEVETISVDNIVSYNVEIYPDSGRVNSFNILAENPHEFNTGDIVTISGLTTSLTIFNELYSAEVPRKNTLSLINTVGLGTTGATGIVTFISVGGNLSNIRENDIFTIGTEKVKVLNVDKNSSRLKILRAVNNTVGSSHSYSDILYENSRRLVISDRLTNPFNYSSNRQIYFNPRESIGVGTAVGIGTTIFISNPGAGVSYVTVPSRLIYLPDHKLETGDQLIYDSNGGDPIAISTNGEGIGANLADGSLIYATNVSPNFIGISTVKVGIGSTGTIVGIASTQRNQSILYFTSFGSGTYHSFKTNYNSLRGNISKNKTIVSTATTHGLSDGDIVFVDVNPSISTSFVVAYSDYNRKLVINPKSFSPVGVNTLTNSITIENHGFTTGQQVIQTSPSKVLKNEKDYYVIVIDKDTIKLSDNYYNSIQYDPVVVGLSSQFGGTLSLVNPPIKLYKNSTVFFDVSDSSLSYTNSSQTKFPAFNFNFYTNSSFEELFESSKNSNFFNIKRVGTVGISSNARISLTITDDIPNKLYYRLDPITAFNLPSVKSEISIDSSVSSHNEISIEDSLYNGKYSIVSTSGTTFTYSLRKKPESNFYDKTQAIINYQTTSKNTKGSISEVEVVSNGQNYYNLPKFSKISSGIGSGAILDYNSKNIGKIKKIKINDIGFNYPSDFTLKPNLSLPQIAKIELLSSFESIQILSLGNGYNHPPKLVVLDGVTKNIVPEVDLEYSFGDSFVTILKNTYGINNVEPIIIPTQNSNGVGISSLVYDLTKNSVTATLSVGFSTADSFPFAVNDKIMVENVSVGINSTGRGFNSKNYNYKLFTITAVSENLGGIGIVTYTMNNVLQPGETPGVYNSTNSSARIIPEKYFPKFKTIFKKNNYLKDEKIRYLGDAKTVGEVEGWNSQVNQLRISSRERIESGKIIQGDTSKTQGLISSVISGDAFINLAPYSKVEDGWETQIGFLSNNLQRIQDSFYYQNFSYSLKSKVPYDTWEDAVGSLNHTLGFRKFGDYQCEPSLDEVKNNQINISPISYVDTFTDIVGVADLNCFYDFDLARENVLIDDSYPFSDQIYFSSRVLTDYYESLNNRVLSIDDFSGSFYNLPRFSRYVVLDTIDTNQIQSQKYITFVKDRRYVGQRQLMLVSVVYDEKDAYLNQYGRVESVYDLGSFDFKKEDNQGSLLFYPNRSLWNDYDVSVLSYNIKDAFVGIASTSFGNVVYIDSKVNQVSSGTTSVIGIGTTFTSVKAIIEISADNGQRQFEEITAIHNGTNIEFINYGQLVTNSSDNNPLLSLGEFDAYLANSKINVDFIATPGIAVTINSIQISIANTESSGIGTYYLRHSTIEGRSTSIASSPTPTANVISEYSSLHNGAYFIVQISDTTNNIHQISEVIVINDSDNSYISEFAILQAANETGIGTITSNKTPNSTQLLFTPIANINAEVKVYSNAMRDYRDASKPLNFNDSTITNQSAVYLGAAVDVKRTFDLNHQGEPIFERYFDGSSPAIVDIDRDLIYIKNHFFVTGEKLTYSSGTLGEINQPIGITTTDFGVGIGTTDRLPSTVYAIKLDQNRIRLAKSASSALKFIPEILNLTSLGIGTNHTFTAANQNSKGLITLDNLIQSPLVATATTTILSTKNLISEDVLYVHNTTNIFSGDLLRIDDEVMRVESVGVGSTNAVRVNRPWLGTKVEEHESLTKVVKVTGNYNIVQNQIHFVEAPYGRVPIGTPTNPPDERDWENIQTNSTFYGRIFMRSGATGSNQDTYYKNYLYDDISNQFDGKKNTFSLTSNAENVSGVSVENAIVIINDIFQEPGDIASYVLEEENVGFTSIRFIGAGTSLASDINTSGLPAGGIIVSVGSTSGFGYQPLVSAGGTAIVSDAGTIQAISIGNSGSGYRQKNSKFLWN